MAQKQNVTVLKQYIERGLRQPTYANAVLSCESTRELSLMRFGERSGLAGKTQQQLKRVEDLIHRCRNPKRANYENAVPACVATRELSLAHYWDHVLNRGCSEEQQRRILSAFREFQKILRSIEKTTKSASHRRQLRAFWNNESRRIALTRKIHTSHSVASVVGLID